MPDFSICRNRPFLLGIDRDTFERLAGIAQYRDYQPGETIMREGEQKDQIMLIEKGQVEVIKAGGKQDSKEHKVTTLAGSNKLYDLYQGDVLGEMSLIDVEPASATVKAVSEVGIWSMDRLEFSAALRENLEAWNTILANIARILSRRLRDTTAKLT
ncbi:MAG: cyclic nucleotide-binding domain-containing protein [Desulfobacterales bacterium]|nr:MAG: cyclic nucleotide-binding domain-containing protein [Desulfobacterales bacterium]